MKNKGWFYLLAISAILIGLYPILYFFIDRRFGLLQSKSDLLLKDLAWNIGFYIHIVFGGLALFIGWTQFVKKWRKTKPIFHKQMGKLYILFVSLSSVSGLYIGFYATGGVIASLGFICLGIFWFASTFLAYQSIKQQNYILHRRLMVYSYAACFAAVTLRVWLPLLTLMIGDFFIAYKIIAWLCWIPNLMVAYFINRQLGNR